MIILALIAALLVNGWYCLYLHRQLLVCARSTSFVVWQQLGSPTDETSMAPANLGRFVRYVFARTDAADPCARRKQMFRIFVTLEVALCMAPWALSLVLR